MKPGVRFLLLLFTALFARGVEAPLPRSTPEAQGVSSAALASFIDGVGEKLDEVHSFMLVRHGHVVAEGWWAPYAAEEPHVLFSLSKSFASTAVGLAVAEGKVNVNDTVLSLFPEDAPAEPSANLKAMRVKDLLTMSTGHHAEDIESFPYFSPDNLVKKFFEIPVPHKPGTHFMYNTPASFMLSAIVSKVTGQNARDYLQSRLFTPLGLGEPKWDATPAGISLGGFGLHLRTEDIAKFGQLYLQKGRWAGRQLVPAAWVAEATARQVSNGSDPDGDWDQGYGYQFWRCRHGFYRGDGAFGQFCIVLEEYDAVVAITSGTKNMGAVMQLVWDRLVPALKSGALPEDPAARAELTGKLAALQLPPLKSSVPADARPKVAGKRFVFAMNATGLQSLVIEPPTAGGEQPVAFKFAGGDRRWVAGDGVWRKDAGPVELGLEVVAVSGGWTAPDRYDLKVCGYRTPFSTTYRLRFAENEVLVDTEQNVGFGATNAPQLSGRME